MSSKPLVSSSVVGSRQRGADLCKEYDTTERDADLYLFTRPVSDNLPDVVMYHHWALVFHFEGNDIRTVEGFGDEDDMLYANYTKESPREDGTYYELGKVLTSPTKVLEMTRSNSQNYTTYVATWQNCQTWVKAIAAELGEEISKKINSFKTLKEARPVFAFAVKKASGASNFSRSLSKKE